MNNNSVKSWQSRLTAKVKESVDKPISSTYRNEINLNVASKANCVCNRPRQLVLCKACGFHFTGRIRKPCPSHPLITFLHDVTACVNCKIDNLSQLQEFTRPNRIDTISYEMMDTGS